MYRLPPADLRRDERLEVAQQHLSDDALYLAQLRPEVAEAADALQVDAEDLAAGGDEVQGAGEL